MYYATNIAFCTPEASACHNEVEFGFTPHAGGSYYLALLPGEIGTYLALTGDWISGGDMLDLGFAEFGSHPWSKDIERPFKLACQLYYDPKATVINKEGEMGEWRHLLTQDLFDEDEMEIHNRKYDGY